MGALGGPPGLVPTDERQSLVTEAYLARNREFESSSLQRRVQCEPNFRGRIPSFSHSLDPLETFMPALPGEQRRRIADDQVPCEPAVTMCA